MHLSQQPSDNIAMSAAMQASQAQAMPVVDLSQIKENLELMTRRAPLRPASPRRARGRAAARHISQLSCTARCFSLSDAGSRGAAA